MTAATIGTRKNILGSHGPRIIRHSGVKNIVGSKNRTVAAGLIWICALQFFVAQVVVQDAWTTPFSLTTNFISDLGNTECANYPVDGGVYVCSPWHALMNLSFFAQGVIIIAGSFLILSIMRRGVAKLIVFTLLILTGIGMLGVGAFPENVNNKWHVYSAALQFVTGNLALMVVGFTDIVPGVRRVYLVAAAMLGAVGLVATPLFATGNHFGLGVGGMERIAAYTFPIWLVGAGILLVTTVSHGVAHTRLER